MSSHPHTRATTTVKMSVNFVREWTAGAVVVRTPSLVMETLMLLVVDPYLLAIIAVRRCTLSH